MPKLNEKLEKKFENQYWIKKLKLPKLIKNELKGFISQLLKEQKEEIIEIIKDLQIEISDSHSGYINKLPQIQILDEIKQIINNLNK